MKRVDWCFTLFVAVAMAVVTGSLCALFGPVSFTAGAVVGFFGGGLLGRTDRQAAILRQALAASLHSQQQIELSHALLKQSPFEMLA